MKQCKVILLAFNFDFYYYTILRRGHGMKKKEVKKKEVKNAVVKAVKFDIRESIRDLLKKSPLLGFIVIKMKPSQSTMLEAGAGITRDCTLLYRPEFFLGLQPRQRAAVLEHEARHIAHRHFHRLMNVKYPAIAMIAKEISINQYIEDIPKSCLLPETFGLTNGFSLEEYYEQLIQKADKQKVAGGKEDENNPLRGDIKESPANSTKPESMYKEARAYAKGIGDKSCDEFEKIEPIPTNWKMTMKKMAGTQPVSTKVRKTYMRPSKRYPSAPGLRKDLGLGKMFVGLDTSGSMGSDELGIIWDAIKKARRRCSEMILIQCDTEVKDVSKVRRRENALAVKGRGGTELSPIIDKARELGFPKYPLVVFTDGQVGSFPTGLKNSLWVFTQKNTYQTFKSCRPEADAAMLL